MTAKKSSQTKESSIAEIGSSTVMQSTKTHADGTPISNHEVMIAPTLLKSRHLGRQPVHPVSALGGSSLTSGKSGDIKHKKSGVETSKRVKDQIGGPVAPDTVESIKYRNRVEYEAARDDLGLEYLLTKTYNGRRLYSSPRDAYVALSVWRQRFGRPYMSYDEHALQTRKDRIRECLKDNHIPQCTYIDGVARAYRPNLKVVVVDPNYLMVRCMPVRAYRFSRKVLIKAPKYPALRHKIIDGYKPSRKVQRLASNVADLQIYDKRRRRDERLAKMTAPKGVLWYAKKGGHTKLYEKLIKGLKDDNVHEHYISRIGSKLFMDSMAKKTTRPEDLVVDLSQWRRVAGRYACISPKNQYIGSRNREAGDGDSGKDGKSRADDDSKDYKNRQTRLMRVKLRRWRAKQKDRYKRFCSIQHENYVNLFSDFKNNAVKIPRGLRYILYIMGTDSQFGPVSALEMIKDIQEGLRTLRKKVPSKSIIDPEDMEAALILGWYGVECPKCGSFVVINRGTHLECLYGHKSPVWFVAVCERCFRLHPVYEYEYRENGCVCKFCSETVKELDPYGNTSPASVFIDVPEDSRDLFRATAKTRNRIIEKSGLSKLFKSDTEKSDSEPSEPGPDKPDDTKGAGRGPSSSVSGAGSRRNSYVIARGGRRRRS